MLTGPPSPTELEVSLFGPGVGESIVIHLADDRWIVVDSCRDKDSSCVPLTYLQSLGVALDAAVTDVVATHAHDDHIRGISQLLEAATGATLSVPSAATRYEF